MPDHDVSLVGEKRNTRGHGAQIRIQNNEENDVFWHVCHELNHKKQKMVPIHANIQEMLQIIEETSATTKTLWGDGRKGKD